MGVAFSLSAADLRPTEYSKHALADRIRYRRPAVRLMAMLHDLTHAPYGHTLEDEIELVDQKHDEPLRQADAYYRLLLQSFGWISRNNTFDAWGALSRRAPVPGTVEYAAAQLEWYLDAPDIHEPPTDGLFIEFHASEWSALLVENGSPSTLRKITPSSLRAFAKDLAFALRALLYLDIAHKPKDAKLKHLPESLLYPFERLLEGIQRNSDDRL